MNVTSQMESEAARQSPLEDDLAAYELIREDLLAHELDLYATKWFDYRMLTPMEATRRYIGVYGDIYKRHYRANLDRRAADYVMPITVDNIFVKLKAGQDLTNMSVEAQAKLSSKVLQARRNFVGCWRGRQVADAIGMPYETYIDLAFTARLSYWNQTKMPQPTHLYSEMVAEKVVARWEDLQGSRLYLSEDPAYMLQNYAGIKHQDDYHEWLMLQAGKRSNLPLTIARFVNEDLLPYDKVETRYDPDTLERISRYLQ